MTQLALFDQPPTPIRRDQREILWGKASSAEVEQEVMAIFTAKPGQWLDWNDFRTIINKHKIGSYFGHALDRIQRSGKTIGKNIYFGSNHPGKPNYLGFKTVYMLSGGPTA